MSATTERREPALDGCRPVDATPVTIDAEALGEPTPAALRSFKATLREDGYVPATLTATIRFDADCSLRTQEAVDDVRSLVDTAAFLGANTLTLTVEAVADASKVRPALNACAERARREGVELEVTGPVSLS